MTALVIASTGTAIAAGLVTGDKLIKKRSLSGNRLRNHTITGTQVNLKKLGKVPSAANADHATSATTASSATTAATATNATNAVNAAALGGAPASAYEPSAHFIRTGLVTATPAATPGATVTLATFGAFTLKLVCVTGTAAGTVTAHIDATSTVANSDGFGTTMTTAGTAYDISGEVGPSAAPGEIDFGGAGFFTPTGQTYAADAAVGVNSLGLTGKCFANALISQS